LLLACGVALQVLFLARLAVSPRHGARRAPLNSGAGSKTDAGATASGPGAARGARLRPWLAAAFAGGVAVLAMGLWRVDLVLVAGQAAALLLYHPLAATRG
jgi:hypothetical protein